MFFALSSPDLSRFFRCAGVGLFIVASHLIGANIAQAQNERIHARAQTTWAARGTETIRLGLLRLAGLPVPARAALQGTLRQAVVLVSFADESISIDSDAIETHYYGDPSDGSETVRSYYTAASNGRFQVEGSVVAHVTLPRSSRDYVGQRNVQLFNGVADSLRTLLLDVLHRVQDVDWTSFADDASGNSRVPALVLLLAGPGGHCAGDQEHVWPHRWHLTGLLGAPYPTASRTAQGDTIYLDDYIVQGVLSCTGHDLAEAGVITHETGHLLGLPDLYHTTDPESRGPVGHWDLMATGNYNMPNSPAMLGAWSRLFLGWVNAEKTPERPASGDSIEIQIAPVNTNFEVVRLPLPGVDEFLLLEYRTRTGPDRHLLGEGLLIWHIDPERVLQHLESNAVNNDFERPGIAVVQADGQYHLEQGTNRGDASDVWPGSANKTTFAPWTTPSLKSRKPGVSVDFYLSGIRQTTDRITFYLHALDGTGSSFTILPEVLVPVVRGQSVKQTFSVVETLDQDSLTWSIDQDLSPYGLTFDAAGILEGLVDSSAPDTITFTVRAQNRDTTLVGERRYDLVVRSPVTISFEEAASRLLDPTFELSQDVLEYLDSIGNRNGRYDLGDLVIAMRSGHLEVRPKQTPVSHKPLH